MREPAYIPPQISTERMGGDVRTVRRFILFPYTLQYVTKWMETAYIRQCWHEKTGWKDINFI